MMEETATNLKSLHPILVFRMHTFRQMWVPVATEVLLHRSR